MIYTPQIATHWTQQEAETAYMVIQALAVDLTREEIETRINELTADANVWGSRMIKDPRFQEDKDRMYARWVAEDRELAAIWSQYLDG